MAFPSIIYWKWDDSHLLTGKYEEQIRDLTARSPFTHIYITTHWCHEGMFSPDTRAHLRRACEQLHALGRKMILELDVRAEKARFSAKNPQARAGFAYWKICPAADDSCTFAIRGSEGGELFGGDRQSGDELLGVIAYRTDDTGRVIPESLRPLSGTLVRPDASGLQVTWNGAKPGEQVFVLVWSIFDFPDLFSPEYYAEADRLMALGAEISPDGAALDELCFMWHPDFDFTPGSYMKLDDCPVYSRGMAAAYAKAFGDDYITDILYRFASSPDDPRRIAAINRYFRCFRDGIAAAENYFYDSVKSTLGPDAFVGVHNTWFCIEEVQNSPEIWRTGVTWWNVRKDFGFTDEIMQYPVRTALAHKASAPIFYNMWYSEGTMQLSTFYPELWRNVRHGGRTISLSYECIHESHIVQQLHRPGELEAIAAIEDRIRGVDEFVQSPARCDVAVVPSLAGWCNRLYNLDGNGRWDGCAGKLKETFSLVRDISAAGWNCDLIGDSEIYNGNLTINEDGWLSYGNQTYTCLILAYPQYAEAGMTAFLETIRASRTKLILIGHADTGFDGLPMADPAETVPEAPFFAYRPETPDLTAILQEWNIARNQVPCGCIMQDGTVIVTAAAPDKPIGNPVSSQFSMDGRRITVAGEDVICLRTDESGEISYWSPAPVTITVEEEHA